MVKKKQKVYLSLGIICLQTTLMADDLAGILVSQKTKDSVIENKNFSRSTAPAVECLLEHK